MLNAHPLREIASEKNPLAFYHPQNRIIFRHRTVSSTSSCLMLPFLIGTFLNSGMRSSRVSLAASLLANFLELPKPFPYSTPLISIVALKVRVNVSSHSSTTLAS